jgi:predicted metal-binding membrane protein
MVAAMMFPVVLGPVRIAAARSLWSRRHRAVAGFLTGYVALWTIVGVPVAGLAILARGRLSPVAAAAAGFAIAVAWQLTSAKRRALSSCHRTIPLAPDGWRADAGCVRFGWIVGGQCVLSCWALMLACVLSAHSLAAMAGLGAAGAAERLVPRFSNARVCGAICICGAVYAMMAIP